MSADKQKRTEKMAVSKRHPIIPLDQCSISKAKKKVNKYVVGEDDEVSLDMSVEEVPSDDDEDDDYDVDDDKEDEDFYIGAKPKKKKKKSNSFKRGKKRLGQTRRETGGDSHGPPLVPVDSKLMIKVPVSSLSQTTSSTSATLESRVIKDPQFLEILKSVLQKGKPGRQ